MWISTGVHDVTSPDLVPFVVSSPRASNSKHSSFLKRNSTIRTIILMSLWWQWTGLNPKEYFLRSELRQDYTASPDDRTLRSHRCDNLKSTRTHLPVSSRRTSGWPYHAGVRQEEAKLVSSTPVRRQASELPSKIFYPLSHMFHYP